MMKLSELKKYVDRYLEYERDDPEVVIQIKLPYSTVGAQPSVGAKSVQMGFDWDAGKFIIVPEEPLTPSDRDFAKQMKEMQERAGWADSENRRLKAELNQLKKKIKGGGAGKYSDVVSDGGMDPR
jgi:hypothetical protein